MALSLFRAGLRVPAFRIGLLPDVERKSTEIRHAFPLHIFLSSGIHENGTPLRGFIQWLCQVPLCRDILRLRISLLGLWPGSSIVHVPCPQISASNHTFLLITLIPKPNLQFSTQSTLNAWVIWPSWYIVLQKTFLKLLIAE